MPPLNSSTNRAVCKKTGGTSSTRWLFFKEILKLQSSQEGRWFGSMDKDLALALQLQAQEDERAASALTQNNAFSPPAAFKSNGTSPLSIVDTRWEAIDPTPDARAMFLEFNRKYFWGKLAGCEVRWSPRMTSCAGICCYEGRGGLCSIRLSEPLLKLRPRKDLVETLLHEMIHAYLFVTANNKDRDGHGPEFCKHMNRLNSQTGTHITIYHSFHDEVNNYKTHWWECNGPCRQRPPYFGMVRRAMNRAPSPRDPWWSQHRENCNGEFIKVKEPEGYGQKKAKVKEMKSPEKPKGVPDIRSMFGGKNGMKQDGNAKKPRPSSAMGKKSTTLINPGRPKSTPIDSDSGKENMVDSDSSLGSPKTTVVGGILSRDKTVEIEQDTRHTLSKKGINTIFQPIDRQVNDKGNVAKTWKVDNSAKTINKANIHTISSSARTAQDVTEFSGAGFTLSKSKDATEDENPPRTIVRRIPGFGIITSERPVASQSNVKDVAIAGSSSSTTVDNAGAMDSDDALLVPSSSSQETVSPLLFDKELSKMHSVQQVPSSDRELLSGSSSKGKTSDAVNSNGKRIYMPYFSSDEDDDDILFKIRKKSDSPPSKRRNIEKKKQNSYPSVGSINSLKYKGKRMFGKSSGPTKASSNINNRAANRNERVLGLGGDSDSETTDDEERKVLGSALHTNDREDDMSPFSISSRASSKNSDTVSSIASIRLMTASEQSVTVISSPDGQDDDVKVKSPRFSTSPIEVLGVDMDMSQFSSHKKNSQFTEIIKKPIPITPPRPSTSYTNTPSGGVKRSSTSEINSVCKKFKFINTEDDDGPVASTSTGNAQLVSNSQSSTGSAFHPYNRSEQPQEDADPLVECPSCPFKFRSSEINEHLDSCLDMLPDL